ncbi:MAG: PatB family C-S lyase [Bacteroidota bacterium]
MIYDFDKLIDRKDTASVKYDLTEKLFGRSDVLPMWVADMDFEVPEFIIEALSERIKHRVFGYTFRPDSFFETIASWISRRHGWDIGPETIAFSPGIVPALNMCIIEFTDPGDAVVVQPPVYFPFFSAVSNHGRKLIHNQLLEENGHYMIDYDALEESFRKGAKMFFLCNPHNPVGRVWTRTELERLADLCVRYQVLVVSDEIHSDLVLGGRKHIPLASLDKEIADLTLTCMAPSKTFNLAGLYTSMVIATNPELKKRYEIVLDAVHVGGDNIFGQLALEAAYTYGDEWLDQLLVYLEKNYQLLYRQLTSSVPGLIVSPLEATYLVWLDFSFLGKSDSELKEFMIRQAGLGLNDGPMFGPGGEQHQRMNIATPHSVLEEGIGRLILAVNGER